MLTIRRHHHQAVAHLAEHDSARGWHSRCSLMWHGSEWVGERRDRLVRRADWQGRGGGHLLHLDDLRELPPDVKLCTYCVARVMGEHDQLVAAMRARGIER